MKEQEGKGKSLGRFGFLSGGVNGCTSAAGRLFPAAKVFILGQNVKEMPDVR
jgi:hypothetical protein